MDDPEQHGGEITETITGVETEIVEDDIMLLLRTIGKGSES